MARPIEQLDLDLRVQQNLARKASKERRQREKAGKEVKSFVDGGGGGKSFDTRSTGVPLSKPDGTAVTPDDNSPRDVTGNSLSSRKRRKLAISNLGIIGDLV